MQFSRGILGVLLLAGLSACSKNDSTSSTQDASPQRPSVTGDPSNPTDPLNPPGPTPIPNATPSIWNNSWWIEKTSRKLRGGIPATKEEIQRLLSTQDRAKMVDQFLEDPRFADTVLDFSLMFIGFRQDRIKTPKGGYLNAVYSYPHAILASKEVAKNGDFFKIFDLAQKIYLPALKRPSNIDTNDTTLSDSALREKIFGLIQTSLDNLIQSATGNPNANDTLCASLKTHLAKYIDADPLKLSDSIPLSFFYSTEYYGGVSQFCTNRPSASYDFLSAFQSIKSKNTSLFATLKPLDGSTYLPQTVNDISALDSSTFAPSFNYNQFSSPAVSHVLQNSSTNQERKRAAYILKRFMCDDLTPVNVENPSTHAGDVHGSNPSCFACHYKLDPMGGFFRFYGAAFQNFQDNTMITFDDKASMPIADYLKNWDPSNVGYIRTTQSPSKNFYGSTLDDLFGFLKSAPETRRCLIKRAYEYLNSSEQTVDGDYLDYLTAQFNQVAATKGSSAALKNTFRSIVLGQTFGTLNANRDACNDLRPGTPLSNHGVPCKVASILNNNCVKCHGSTDDHGSLDLSHWEKTPDGLYGFPHLARDGSAIGAKKTFQTVIDRISSTDPDLRMPYLTDMPSQDRQLIFTWLNQILNEASK